MTHTSKNKMTHTSTTMCVSEGHAHRYTPELTPFQFVLKWGGRELFRQILAPQGPVEAYELTRARY